MIKILIDIAISLEFCDESLIDPDLAVQILESMALELQSMRVNNKISFVNKVNEISKEYNDQHYKSFVQDLAYNLGVTDKNLPNTSNHK